MSLSMQPSTATAYVALGSNLGDREGHLRSAIAELRLLGHVTAVSSFYETEPVGTVPQPDFLNAVAELETRLLPEDLLSALLRIEQEHGRDRTAGPAKGPRTLDLDLLAYDSLVLETPMLTLPHPAMAQRRFVLIPLAEIAPGWRHPLYGKTAGQLLMALQQAADRGPAVRQIQKCP
jgi:2-amino-4-hydroxy-6-hydroxymethyldihydropteridine diphosphokinase